jgi:probable rRNA maturation factor
MRKIDIELLILDESSRLRLPLNKREMVRCIREALLVAEACDGSYEASLYIVDDVRMRALNMEHRGVDRTTDVLSFPQYGSLDESAAGEYGRVVLGDVVISLQTLRRRCASRDENQDMEFARLLIHGILHLAGMDHRTRAQREHMRKTEEHVIDTIFV